MSTIYLDSTLLSNKMTEILTEKGVCATSVHHVVESLIQTSLRGVDSHGIGLFPHYCNAVDGGRINKNPNISINTTAAGTAVVDADHAFGHHAGAAAIDYAVELASKAGIAAVNVQNSSHFGAAAYFALRASNKNMIGFSFTNADALVKAFGSKEAFFGTNPICFTAPMSNEEPLCLDMATSLVSWNKIKIYRHKDEEIPAHWAYDGNGESTTNPHIAKCLAPAGGYKGFGLGMMVDILCATLAGGLCSKDVLPMFTSPIEAQRRISHFFMVIDVSKFLDVELFKSLLQNISDRIRLMPRTEEEVDVMIPGDPEKKAFVIRKANGIPIDESKFEEFLNISDDFRSVVLPQL